MSLSPSVVDLKRFLVAAKQATYASQGDAAPVDPLLPDAKQLEFAEGCFSYRDIYVGMLRFVGQEIVYQSGRAVWSMSYSGGLIPEVSQDSAGAVYAFLRKALRVLPPELPLRGPTTMEENGMRYVCRCEGSVEAFNGVETITENGVCLYQLHFSGGMLA